MRGDLDRAREALERARDDYAEEREARKVAEREREHALLALHSVEGTEEILAHLVKQREARGGVLVQGVA